MLIFVLLYPIHRTSLPGNVTIRHPGYQGPLDDILFQFQARDNAGLHHGVALAACAIVTGNKWNGYLSKTRGGKAFLSGVDQCLPVGDYYFYPDPPDALEESGHDDLRPTIPSPSDPSTHPYPVYSTFQDWPFPHADEYPSWWKAKDHDQDRETPARTYSASSYSAAVEARDMSCRLTRHVEATEAARIVPNKEELWFALNHMSHYSWDKVALPQTENAANAILLRCDIHRTYDQMYWTIVPKNSVWLVHVLIGSRELEALYHNVSLQSIQGVSKEYLLAGFAHAIFPFLYGFLRSGKRRFVMGETVDAPEGKWIDNSQFASGRSSPEEASDKSSPRERGTDAMDAMEEATVELNKKRGRSLSAESRENIMHPSTKRRKQSSDSADVSQLKHIETMKTYALPMPCASRPRDDEKCHSINDEPLAWTSEEEKRIAKLRAIGLRKEREASEVTEWWEDQLAWAHEAEKGTFMGAEACRWFWTMGKEIATSDGEPAELGEDLREAMKLENDRTA